MSSNMIHVAPVLVPNEPVVGGEDYSIVQSGEYIFFRMVENEADLRSVIWEEENCVHSKMEHKRVGFFGIVPAEGVGAAEIQRAYGLTWISFQDW